MDTGLLHLHNIMRWVILILLLIAMFQAFSKKNNTAPGGLNKVSLFLLISAHITLLLGLYQWLAGRYGLLTTTRPNTEISLMKDAFYRFFWVEHPLAMIIAIVLVTIARGKVKKQNYRAASILYVIALLAILAAVPWPFREAVARPLFPGA